MDEGPTLSGRPGRPSRRRCCLNWVGESQETRRGSFWKQCIQAWGEGTCVFLETTRFPGPGLEWAGGRCGQCGRPGVADGTCGRRSRGGLGHPRNPPCPESWRPVGPGLTLQGPGQGRASWRALGVLWGGLSPAGVLGVGCLGVPQEAGPRPWRRPRAGPGPSKPSSSRGQPGSVRWAAGAAGSSYR